MTLYTILLRASGLSQREAAAFHAVRLDTIKSWCIGRRQASDGVIAEISTLICRQVEAAEQAEDTIGDGDLSGGVVELGLAADDVEAQSLGWPTVTAQAAALGLIAARVVDAGGKVEIVPRGSTEASAAAADAHDQIL